MTDHDALAARVRADRDHAHPCDCEHDDCIHDRAYQDAPVYGDLCDAYLDLYDEVQRLRAERDALQSQCCMCGKTGLSIIEDGGPECELDDGRWVCSVDCYDLAVLNHLVAEAERDRLRAALNEIATAASGIAHDLQIGPDDEGRDIHEMALAIRDDARAALKGDSDE